MNLINQFKLIGNVIEGRVSAYPSYYKCRFDLRINNHTPISISYFVSRRYNADGYNKMTELINRLSSTMPSYVYVDNEKIFKFNGENQRLFAMGNLSTDGKRLFFNADYIEIADKKLDNFIDIRLDGQWIDDSHMLTIQNDRPLVFEISRPIMAKGLCSCEMLYNSGYSVVDNMIYPDYSGLTVWNALPKDENINSIDKWLLEWSIISDDK